MLDHYLDFVVLEVSKSGDDPFSFLVDVSLKCCFDRPLGWGGLLQGVGRVGAGRREPIHHHRAPSVLLVAVAVLVR